MKKVKLSLGDRSYSILVSKGLIKDICKYTSSFFPGKKVLVVSDTTVGRLYGINCVEALRKGGMISEIINVPVGEKSKSIEQLDKIFNKLSRLKVGREDGIIALGGGVVGDLAGLAAATFLRGISLVQVPTTLLSQVDSSVGGKTAINTIYGKNLVGSFFQPRVVLCDLETMFSLRQREFRNGLAEVVKHAVIRDESFFDFLEKNTSKILNRDSRSLEKIVFRNCRIKGDVVEIDETERGLRQILNFGHTLGHALESLFGFSKKLLHGEAVSIGMSAVAQMSFSAGFCEKEDVNRLQKLLTSFKLPIKLQKAPSLREVKRYVLHDKKVRDGKPKFVILKKIGNVESGIELNSQLWSASIEGKLV
tara:strand:- start:25156 stop:26247 length:1092 start_codon:yes stop_codon:yes gene_type:complete